MILDLKKCKITIVIVSFDPNRNETINNNKWSNIKGDSFDGKWVDDTTFIIEVQGIPDVNNVFSPNGDGVNDYFEFGEYGIASITVDIYNRWGQLVFTWETNDDNWDGTGLNGEALPEGVYYYVLKASGEDGHAYDKRGSVTLFR